MMTSETENAGKLLTYLHKFLLQAQRPLSYGKCEIYSKNQRQPVKWEIVTEI